MTALSVVFGIAKGQIFGLGGFLLATAFPAMLRAALPGMTGPWFLGLWIAAVAVPILAFSRVFRKGRLGARCYATCGIAALVILFVGDLTGTITVYPWNTSFYVVPDVFDRPATPAPTR